MRGPSVGTPSYELPDGETGGDEHDSPVIVRSRPSVVKTAPATLVHV